MHRLGGDKHIKWTNERRFNAIHIFPITPETRMGEAPRNTGQGWAQYVYEPDIVEILELSTAPARVLRQIPINAKEEAIQVITGILCMHSRAQREEA